MAYPTDSRLLERDRQHLVKPAGALGITLRQNYNREAHRLAVKVRRYGHAKQHRRMKAGLKSLRTLVGRVWRDIDRKLDHQNEGRRPVSWRASNGCWNKSPNTKTSSTACIEQVSILSAQKPKAVFVDKAYRGVRVDGVSIWYSGQMRGLTTLSIRKAIRKGPANPSVN